ncbi:ketoacyl-ACP synthase III [Nonomuraea sp. NN258]|uniref:3-oxoacyl-ACP synthase III family protein n=1 Tax=Nonomuraea antri TaxID=2730852 RepID=UPI00156A1742|nr:3-oxoacyl-[acyl-carrier-protein] synthase III C-terminal domain-containing protein [Nonomuraea antri]NRQ37741.1 ketoacyl-ACP synthase III [Nonomuraea antri]
MSARRYAQVAEVAVHLPGDVRTTAELEELLAERNPGVDIPRGAVERLTGVRRRHVAPPGLTASDLATAAARAVLRQSGHAPPALDLIIYAGVSADAVEPATAHLVAARLGAGCPVFDVRNACNGVLNAIELADLYITSGRHRTVLIACGEVATSAIRWQVSGPAEFTAAVPSYAGSDSGTALLMQAGTTPGVLGHEFCANSAYWEAAVMPIVRDGGGQRIGPLAVDAASLAIGLQKLDLDLLRRPLTDRGLDWSDMAAICVHQPTGQSLDRFCELAGLPRDKVVHTVAEHGDLAASTLPVQLHQAAREGRVTRGDLVALIGLAGGLSAGTMLIRW